MKINWKVRFKNPVFWSTIIPAAVGLIYTVLGALEIVAPIAESEVLNIVAMVISLLTTVGVLVDPTTAGVGDSALALTYDKPRKDDTGEEAAVE